MTEDAKNRAAELNSWLFLWCFHDFYFLFTSFLLGLELSKSLFSISLGALTLHSSSEDISTRGLLFFLFAMLDGVLDLWGLLSNLLFGLSCLIIIVSFILSKSDNLASSRCRDIFLSYLWCNVVDVGIFPIFNDINFLLFLCRSLYQYLLFLRLLRLWLVKLILRLLIWLILLGLLLLLILLFVPHNNGFFLWLTFLWFIFSILCFDNASINEFLPSAFGILHLCFLRLCDPFTFCFELVLPLKLFFSLCLLLIFLPLKLSLSLSLFLSFLSSDLFFFFLDSSFFFSNESHLFLSRICNGSSPSCSRLFGALGLYLFLNRSFFLLLLLCFSLKFLLLSLW